MILRQKSKEHYHLSEYLSYLGFDIFQDGRHSYHREGESFYEDDIESSCCDPRTVSKTISQFLHLFYRFCFVLSFHGRTFI